MAPRVGINGFGRTGRLALRLAIKKGSVDVVAINDPYLDLDHMVYLMKYDSTHGKYKGTVSSEEGRLVMDGIEIAVYHETNPANVPWDDNDVEYVIESSGKFTRSARAALHLTGSVKKVVITTPSPDAPMFVMGVNESTYDPRGSRVLSSSSCTTNGLAPLVKIIHEKFGIIEGLMTSIHGITSRQRTLDGAPNKSFRDGRGAHQNIIPVPTGAAVAVTEVIPELKGKLTGSAYRVPTASIGVVDLICRLQKPVSYEDVKQAVRLASEKQMRGYISYTDDEIVSSDLEGEECSSVFDATAGMQLNETFFKLVVWYDNEIGYSARVIDLVAYVASRDEDEIIC